ncbi:unnamed protein product [Haemonchus placei]|uniref:VWFA domain-containing protein n=1 Tax=Haemonchus placei TaxID=6290 RepID=A0A0N4W8Y5_HAEPC|nr:unnamed protein product [Haemonchus placei]
MGNSSFSNWSNIEKRHITVNSMSVTDQTADHVSRSVCAPTNTPAPFIRTSRGCECVPKTIWLDVFLLMEAGVLMGSNGIASATDYVVSAFAQLTVGQAEQFQTRLGIIRYASSVELIADLDAYTSKADLFDLDILPLNETGTNIEGFRETVELCRHPPTVPSLRAFGALFQRVQRILMGVRIIWAGSQKSVKRKCPPLTRAVSIDEGRRAPPVGGRASPVDAGASNSAL